MAQWTIQAAAVKNHRGPGISRQFALEFLKLGERDIDGRWDVAFIIFGLLGP